MPPFDSHCLEGSPNASSWLKTLFPREMCDKIESSHELIIVADMERAWLTLFIGSVDSLIDIGKNVYWVLHCWNDTSKSVPLTTRKMWLSLEKWCINNSIPNGFSCNLQSYGGPSTLAWQKEAQTLETTHFTSTLHFEDADSMNLCSVAASRLSLLPRPILNTTHGRNFKRFLQPTKLRKLKLSPLPFLPNQSDVYLFIRWTMLKTCWEVPWDTNFISTINSRMGPFIMCFIVKKGYSLH